MSAEWRGDMEHYRKVHQELIDEANKSSCILL